MAKPNRISASKNFFLATFFNTVLVSSFAGLFLDPLTPEYIVVICRNEICYTTPFIRQCVMLKDESPTSIIFE